MHSRFVPIAFVSSLATLALFASCVSETYTLGNDKESVNAATCSDGLDNDGDGLFDCDDPDCAGSAQEGVPGPCAGSPDAGFYTDAGTVAECADGFDNDGDGLIDYPSDPGCDHPGDDSEDTGAPDAAVLWPDAGVWDGGMAPDAGFLPDAGVWDGGTPPPPDADLLPDADVWDGGDS